MNIGSWILKPEAALLVANAKIEELENNIVELKTAKNDIRLNFLGISGKYDKALSRITELEARPKTNGKKISFHGGCAGCSQQGWKRGTDFCYDCKFFWPDWNMPDLNNRERTEIEIERTKVIIRRELSD